MSPTKPPSDVDPATAGDFDKDAGELLAAAERIMQAIAKDASIDLGRPIDLLALQLLGPCLSRAIGEEGLTLRASMKNLMHIAELIDVMPLRALLQQKGTPRA